MRPRWSAVRTRIRTSIQRRLNEQAALIDGVCGCTDAFKTPPSPAVEDGYDLRLAQVERCIDQKQVGLLASPSPSGIEAGVVGNDLYQRPEVKQLKARWSACTDKLKVQRLVDTPQPLAR